MELLNVGLKGRDKYTKLDHGVQQMRPQVLPIFSGSKALSFMFKL